MVYEINKNLCVFKLAWANPAKSHNYKIIVNTDRASAHIKNADSALTYYAASVLISENIEADTEKRIRVIISDDTRKHYLSFIYANGAVVPYTEKTTADLKEMTALAKKALADNDNIDRVLAFSDIKLGLPKAKYSTFERSAIAPKSSALLKKQSALRPIPIAAAFLLLGFAGWGAYSYYTPAVRVVEEEIKTKKTTPDYTAFYRGCIEGLAQLWPISPEWQQSKEGCIGDPAGVTNTLLPRLSDPYVFREYTLSASWNTFLATEAGRAVANLRPQATIILAGNRLVSYSSLAVDQMDRPENYTAPTAYSSTVDALFLGALLPYQNNAQSPAGTAFKTTLDIETTIGNLRQLDVTPTSIVWDSLAKQTQFSIKPLTVKLVTVRANDAKAGDAE